MPDDTLLHIVSDCKDKTVLIAQAIDYINTTNLNNDRFEIVRLTGLIASFLEDIATNLLAIEDRIQD